LISLIKAYYNLKCDSPESYSYCEFDSGYGWNGDKILLYSDWDFEDPFDYHRSVFILKVKFDTEGHAKMYAKLLGEMLKGKYSDSIELTDYVFKNSKFYRFVQDGHYKYAIIGIDKDKLIFVDRLQDQMFADFMNINGGNLLKSF